MFPVSSLTYCKEHLGILGYLGKIARVIYNNFKERRIMFLRI